MSESRPPPAAVAPLPLWPTLAACGRLLLHHAPALATAVGLPLLLNMATDFAVFPLEPPFSGIVKIAIYNLVWVLFAVTWVRLLLLDDRGGLRFFPNLRQQHARVAGYALLLTLLDLPLPLLLHAQEGGAVGEFPGPIYWIAYLVLGFIKLRLAFVYAAAAVGEAYGPGLAWRHSGGSAGTFFAAALIGVFLPVIGLTWVFCNLPEDATQSTLLALWLLWHALGWLLEAFYLTLVVVAFRTCTGWVPPPNNAVAERFD